MAPVLGQISNSSAYASLHKTPKLTAFKFKETFTWFYETKVPKQLCNQSLHAGMDPGLAEMWSTKNI
jgi:hypothetical protein